MTNYFSLISYELEGKRIYISEVEEFIRSRKKSDSIHGIELKYPYGISSKLMKMKMRNMHYLYRIDIRWITLDKGQSHPAR